MRKLCPKCQGGRSRELSLSSIEHGGVTTWHCWRAKCGYRAAEFTDDTQLLQSTARPRHVPQIEPLSEAALAYLRKYHIDNETVARFGIKGTSYDRLMLPIYSPRGNLRGWNVRGTRSGQAKACIHCKASLTLSWYQSTEPLHGSPVIAVEDQLSAIRFAAAGISACSLLGTNVTQAKIMEIDKVSHGKWLLALDADAIGKALLHTKRHDIRVLRLSRDAKNCTPSELSHVIQRAIHAISGSNQQQRIL